jgi:DNA (cytosine-5)-methyltransferase 1
MGYHRAGFEVVGVDIKPQPRYPFEFHQADARTFDFAGFDFIHASPPCQAYSDMKYMPTAREHDALIPEVRARLIDSGLPWIMENVEGAPLEVGPPSLFWSTSGVTLCGSMFNLETSEFELRRHRLFESSFPLKQPSCQHKNKVVIGFYGDHARIRRRRIGSKDRGSDITGRSNKLALVKDLMGIDWMEWSESNQAIPPAYTEFIGRQFMESELRIPVCSTTVKSEERTNE